MAKHDRPHCNNALMPEDVVGGLTSMSKELVRAARKRKADLKNK